MSHNKRISIVQLKINNVSKHYYVHKLVAEVWLPKPIEGQTFVTHLDGNLKNNHVSNLKWLTKDELIIQHRELNKHKQKPTFRKKVISQFKTERKRHYCLKNYASKRCSKCKNCKDVLYK